MSVLTDPVTMGAVELKNRLVMAPLTRNRAKPDGTPSDLAATYYGQRASGGLIITEATQISALGKGYINTPGIHTANHLAAWKEITKAVHDKGGKIFVQLWHVGRIGHDSLLPEGEKLLAPSAIQAQAQTFIATGPVDVSEPRAMTEADIKTVVQQYVDAAQMAMDAGFDGVEVHAANGYLLDQFLSDHANKRTDSYGGTYENRMRLVFEVLDAVVATVGADRTGIRLSPTGTFNDIAHTDAVAQFTPVIEKLNGYGLAYMHMVERFPGIDLTSEEETIVNQLRQKWTGFYIANGGYDKATGLKAIEGNYAHAVAYGRPYIANPDLAERFAADASLNELDGDTLYGGDAKGYTDYPSMDQAS